MWRKSVSNHTGVSVWAREKGTTSRAELLNFGRSSYERNAGMGSVSFTPPNPAFRKPIFKTRYCDIHLTCYALVDI